MLFENEPIIKISSPDNPQEDLEFLLGVPFYVQLARDANEIAAKLQPLAEVITNPPSVPMYPVGVMAFQPR